MSGSEQQVIDGPDTADEIAKAVLAVPGVVGLYGGVFGELATYLPGRRVAGVAFTGVGVDVHIVVDVSFDLRKVATKARDAAERIAGREVMITIEDISGVAPLVKGTEKS